MKNQVSQLVILPVGIIIGIGIGMLISKPKIDKSQETLDQFMTQMQTSQADSQQKVQDASAQAARYKNELSRTQSVLIRNTTELSKVKAELQKIQPQTQSDSTASLETSPTTTVSTAPVASASSVQTVEYTVKEGDSLWNIAEAELGNGIRYKEILKLNPNVTENTVLHEGKKLKIPSR